MPTPLPLLHDILFCDPLFCRLEINSKVLCNMLYRHAFCVELLSSVLPMTVGCGATAIRAKASVRPRDVWRQLEPRVAFRTPAILLGPINGQSKLQPERRQ